MYEALKRKQGYYFPHLFPWAFSHKERGFWAIRTLDEFYFDTYSKIKVLEKATKGVSW